MKRLARSTAMVNSTRIHEENYRLLMRLLSATDIHSDIDTVTFSDVFGLEVNIIEYTRYTTMLELSKCIDRNGNLLPDLLIRVRAYHDASVAEVIAYQGLFNIPPPYMVKSTGQYQKDEKKQINQLLHELLRFCFTGGCRPLISGCVNV